MSEGIDPRAIREAGDLIPLMGGQFEAARVTIQQIAQDALADLGGSEEVRERNAGELIHRLFALAQVGWAAANLLHELTERPTTEIVDQLVEALT